MNNENVRVLVADDNREFCRNLKDYLATTEGIELFTIPVGTKLKIGECVIEISQIGKECHEGCAIQKLVGKCVMPREGVFATVLKGGKVFEGDKIEIIE